MYDLIKPVQITAHKYWNQHNSRKGTKGMVKKKKPSRSPEVNESKKLTDKKKLQASNPKRYRGKKTRTKTQGSELESNTNFRCRRSDLEGYIFDIGPIASDKFARKMKELDWYLESTYSDSYQPSIMTKTP